MWPYLQQILLPRFFKNHPKQHDKPGRYPTEQANVVLFTGDFCDALEFFLEVGHQIGLRIRRIKYLPNSRHVLHQNGAHVTETSFRIFRQPLKTARYDQVLVAERHHIGLVGIQQSDAVPGACQVAIKNIAVGNRDKFALVAGSPATFRIPFYFVGPQYIAFAAHHAGNVIFYGIIVLRRYFIRKLFRGTDLRKTPAPPLFGIAGKVK